MKKIFIFVVFVAAFSMFAGCGHKEGVRQPDSQSYIHFTGNTVGAIAVIDDNAPFEVFDSSGQTGQNEGKTLYEVPPGKHEVIVKKGGEVVVHRVLMIGAGATKEVPVP